MKFYEILQTVLVVFVSYLSALRHDGLYPSFSDQTPSDGQLMADGLGYEDTVPAFDPDGFSIPVEAYNYRIFNTVVKYLTCFDVGMCECDGANPITRTITANVDPPGDPLSGLHYSPNFCLMAPNWLIGTTGMEYLVSHRHVDANNPFQELDINMISSDINRILHQWPQAWKAKYAEIITWKITKVSTGSTDKFQVVITKGDDDKTYVMYLYETVGTFSTTTPVRGVLNGDYVGAESNVKSARICSGALGSELMPTSEEFTLNSNYKCGRNGVFLFPMEDGDECQGVGTCTAYEDTVNPNCNRSSVPQDTCTEGYFCHLDADGNIVLDITLKWYQWKSLKALDYTTFIGEADGGSEDNPRGVQVSVGPNEICRKDDLPHPGMNDPTVARYTLTQPEDSNPALCGTVIDTTAKTIKFAYKNYNYDPDLMTADLHQDVDQEGDLIVFGTCQYNERPILMTQTIMFNDAPAPTEVAPRSRTITFDVTDRSTADGMVLTEVKVGRDIYLRVCFNPGIPFNRGADPFGIYVKDCMASNNPGFLINLASYHRMQDIIQNSCPVTPPAGPIYLTQAFKADMDHSMYDGSGWCVLTGKIDASRWYTLNGGLPVTTMYFRCTVGFCTKEDGVGFGQGFDQQKCIDNCESDNAKKRRRRQTESTEKTETVTTYVKLTTVKELEPNQHDDSRLYDNPSSTVSIVTIAVAVALVIFAIAICVFLYFKLRARKDVPEEKFTTQEPYQKFYI